jgi:hypothetical protein
MDMQVGVILVSVSAFVLLGFALVGGPMLLVDWSRNRREAAIGRQIALTDALDAQLGATVSSVVRKPLFGPWEIQIAVPVSRVAAVGRVLAIVGEVLSGGEGMSENSYRVVLSATQESLGEARAHPARPLTKCWAGGPVAAA